MWLEEIEDNIWTPHWHSEMAQSCRCIHIVLFSKQYKPMSKKLLFLCLTFQLWLLEYKEVWCSRKLYLHSQRHPISTTGGLHIEAKFLLPYIDDFFFLTEFSSLHLVKFTNLNQDAINNSNTRIDTNAQLILEAFCHFELLRKWIFKEEESWMVSATMHRKILTSLMHVVISKVSMATHSMPDSHFKIESFNN